MIKGAGLPSVASKTVLARQSGHSSLFRFCILIMHRMQNMCLQSKRTGNQQMARPDIIGLESVQPW